MLRLKPTLKLIKECREKDPDLVIIGFKAETGVGREELLRRATATLEGSKLDMIAANDVGKGGMGTEENELYLLGRIKGEPRHISGNKRKLAESEILRVQQAGLIHELQLREEIGRDLHDDIGVGLSGIKLRSEMALRVEQDSDKRAQLSKLAVSAGDLIGNMRQIIWSMNPDQENSSMA